MTLLVVLLAAASLVALFKVPLVADWALGVVDTVQSIGGEYGDPYLLALAASFGVIALASLLEHAVVVRWLFWNRLVSSVKAIGVVVGVWAVTPALISVLSRYSEDPLPYQRAAALFACWGAIFMNAVLTLSPLLSALGRRAEIPETSPEGARLYPMLRELAERARVRVPRLAVIAGPPNAMASGLFPFRPQVIVTSGLLEVMDDQELRAVLAHEIAHIQNGDSSHSTLLAYVYRGYLIGFSAAFGMATIAAAESRSGRGSRDEPDFSAGLALGLFLLALLLQVIVLATLAFRGVWSRSREYLADQTAAALTGDTDGMVSALSTLEEFQAAGLPDRVSLADAHCLAASPTRFAFATHPSMASRRARLLALDPETRGVGLRWEWLGSLIPAILCVAMVVAARGLPAPGMTDGSKAQQAAAGTAEPSPQSYCGSELVEHPPADIPVERWVRYRCSRQADVGESTWSACFPRSAYSSRRGRGCPGEELCCPP